ncbi:MAG: type II CRISPR RNA-guided endonuclease Cas9 [Magnetovibrionaceae bacterium]
MAFAWGIDVGVASLAIFVIELDDRGDPLDLVDGAVVTYKTPTGSVDCRLARNARTQNQRKSGRLGDLKKRLSAAFILPANFDAIKGQKGYDTAVVPLRSRGLSDVLSANDLARAIVHIAKNRGQRLSRGLSEKEGDASARQERTKTAGVAAATRDLLAELESSLARPAHPADLLAKDAEAGKATRQRADLDKRRVFTRGMVEAELKALLTAQQPHHVQLTADFMEDLIADVFWEATPPAPRVGTCRYDSTQERLSRGSHLFQVKRIYEQVNNLRLIDPENGQKSLLTLEQRDILVAHLMAGKKLNANQVRTLLGLKKQTPLPKVSLDLETEKEIKPHPLAEAFKSAKALAWWEEADDSLRETLATLLREEDDSEVVVAALVGHGLEEKIAQIIAEKARLPAQYGAAGREATEKLLVQLRRDVIDNSEAEARAGLKPLELPEDYRCDRLPYYGEILRQSCIGGDDHPKNPPEIRYGTIPNPVVHVALNKIRRMANAYLKLYGKPVRICVELARDMNKSAEERDEIEKRNVKNRKANEAHIEEHAGLKRKLGRKDQLALRLHRLQEGLCLYSGEAISNEALFDGSVEIDHILPRSKTLDDGISNLALVFKDKNQRKQNQSPYDAFGTEPDYAQILERAAKRGRGVFWRFAEDAMDQFKEMEAFRARFLNDTRYIAKQARAYLRTILATESGAIKPDVVCLNGRMTSDLKHWWGLGRVIPELMIEEGRLDEAMFGEPGKRLSLEERREKRKHEKKLRFDHRHHLLDALVAACVTRSDVQRLQTLTGQDGDMDSAVERLARARAGARDFSAIGINWQEGFKGRVMAYFRDRRDPAPGSDLPLSPVVRRADHNPAGALHKDTNFKVICAVPGTDSQHIVADHQSIESLGLQRVSVKTGKLELKALEVERTVFEALQKAKEEGETIYWGKDDPLSALANLQKDLVDLRSGFMALIDETPPDIAGKSTFAQQPLQWAAKEYVRRTGRRRFTRIQKQSVRVIQGPEAAGKAPRRACAPGNNHRLVVYLDPDLKMGWEVVSTLDANKARFKERWQEIGGRLLFRLHKDDVVEMTEDPEAPEPSRCLYRTVSLSEGDLEFIKLSDARGVREVPKGVSVRLSSLGALAERDPLPVVLDITGRFRWRPRGRN